MGGKLEVKLQGHVGVVLNLEGEGAYRVMVYSDNGAPIPAGTHEIFLALQPSQLLPAAQRVISTSAALLTNKVGEDQRVAAQSARFDVATTGIHTGTQTTAIRGGEALVVETVTARQIAVYALDGRCIKVVNLKPGINTITLPNGIYIVDETKVTISK